MFQKNVANQPVYLYAYDSVTREPKTGQAANLTVRLSKDAGSLATVTNSVSEVDATNAKGLYVVLLTQTESNADALLVVAVCSTANVGVEPQVIYPVSASSSSAPTAAEIADAMLDELLSGHSVSGSVAAALSSLLGLLSGVDVTKWKGATAPALSGDPYAKAVEIKSVVDAMVASGVLLAATQSLYAPAKANDAMTLTPGERASLADALCDEALSGHSTAGTLGKALYDLAAGAVAMILTAAYDAAKTAASAGALTTVSGKVDGVQSAVGVVDGKVDAVDTAVAGVKAVVDAIKTVVDATKVVADAVRVVTDRLGGMIELDGAVYRFTLNALEQGPTGSGSSPEDVALAVLAAAVGAGGATVGDVLRACRAAAVGKLEKVDATTYRLYDDDGVTVVATFAVSAGGRNPAA